MIDAGLKVHRVMRPGLLESVYEHCLFHKLQTRGVRARSQVALPIIYEGTTLDAGYRIDLLVEDILIVEVKAVEVSKPVHQAQILTFLRLSGCRIGLLMNFNVVLFKQGLRRFVL